MLFLRCASTKVWVLKGLIQIFYIYKNIATYTFEEIISATYYFFEGCLSTIETNNIDYFMRIIISKYIIVEKLFLVDLEIVLYVPIFTVIFVHSDTINHFICTYR